MTSKIYLNAKEFLPVLASWRLSGEEVVFTNGCFDLIHHGHVDSLEKSAGFGSKLVVGLNSDVSVQKLKGPGRPILEAKARAKILAAFQFVDAVVLFEEETPASLIDKIIPDVLVKGNEYTMEEIAGHETVLRHGGRIERLELIGGISTSELINRIKKLD